MARHCPNPDCAGLARDGVVAEYVDSVERCLDCGDATVSGTWSPPEVALEFNELATVFIASGTVQGEIVAALLEANGIPVFVKGASLQGALGELPADVVQVELQVPPERMDEARALTARWEGRDLEATEAVDTIEARVRDALEKSEGES